MSIWCRRLEPDYGLPNFLYETLKPIIPEEKLALSYV